MKRLPFLFASALLLGLLSCGKNESPEDTIPPVRPAVFPLVNMESASFDSSSGPFVLGQFSRNGFRIAWQNPPVNDVVRWLVNYRNSRSGNTPSGVELSSTAREYVVRDEAIYPDPNTDSVRAFEYWVHAVDEAGNVSAASDTIHFSILREAEGLRAENVDLGIPLFLWNNPYSNPEQSPNRYALKVFTVQEQLVWQWYRIYDNSQQVAFNDDGTAAREFLDENNRLLPGEYFIRFEFWQTNTPIIGGSVAQYSFTIN